MRPKLCLNPTSQHGVISQNWSKVLSRTRSHTSVLSVSCVVVAYRLRKHVCTRTGHEGTEGE
jgi:hypothetical protein